MITLLDKSQKEKLSKIGVSRTYAASFWRKLLRMFWVAAGFAVYIWIQLLVARSIINGKHIFVIAAIAITSLLAFSWVFPVVGFGAFIVVSPLAAGFLQLKSSLPDIRFESLMIYVLTLIVMLRSFIQYKGFRKIPWPIWLLSLFPIYIMFNYWYQGRDVQFNLFRDILETFGFWPILFFLTLGIVKTKKQIVALSVCLFGVAFAQSIALIFEQVTGFAYISIFYGRPIPLKYLGWSDVGAGRSVGMFESPVVGSVFLPAMMYLGLHFAAVSKKTFAKAVYYSGALLIPVATFFTYSRSPYVLLLLTMIILPFLFVRQKKQSIIILLVLTFVIVFVALPYSISRQDISNRMTKTSTIDDRANFNRTALNVIENHLWMGVGYQNYRDVARDHTSSLAEGLNIDSTTGLKFTNFVHNTYLYVTAEQGLIGASLYFLGLVGISMLLIKIRSDVDAEMPLGKDFISIVLVFSLLQFVHFTVYSNHYAPYMNYVSFILYGLAYRYWEIDCEEKEEVKKHGKRITGQS